MKILEIATEVPPFKGGISRLVGVVADGLEKQGHEVSLLSPKWRFGEFKLSSIPFRRYGGFDIIHVWGPTPFLSDLLCLTNKVPQLVFTHVAEICWKSEFVSLAYRTLHDFAARNASTVITLSEDYASMLRARGYRNVRVIRPPFRLDEAESQPSRFTESKSSDFTVLYVGQLRPFKAVDILIRAAAELKDVNFIVEGRGYLENRLEQLAKSLSCHNVRFVKAKGDDELTKLYKESHVICLPSRNTTEAYGMVLLEGASFACVPVATDLLGVRENIRQIRGFEIHPNDHQSITKVIRFLKDNPEEWLKSATNSYYAARKYRQRYSTDYYIDKHLEVFRDMLQR